MLKIIGLAVLFCSVSSMGILASGGLKERVQRLNEFQKIVSQFSIYTQYVHTDIFETMRRISASEKSELLLKLLDLEKSWNRASVEQVLSVKQTADKEAMLEFFTSIGTSDLAGQAAICQKAACQVEILLKEANSELTGKGKMYRSLGLCAGLAAVIIFV